MPFKTALHYAKNGKYGAFSTVEVAVHDAAFFVRDGVGSLDGCNLLSVAGLGAWEPPFFIKVHQSMKFECFPLI